MDPYNSADGRAPSAPHANPYAAPDARVADFAQGEAQVKSSRGVRLGAVLLDSLPIGGLAIVAAIVLPATQRADGRGLSTIGAVLLAVMVLAMIAFCIYQLVQLHRSGQTFGKKVLGIRIVRNDGSGAGLGRIFWLRYFVPGMLGAIPLAGPVFTIVDALFIFGDAKRCIHDMIADTIVVDA
jgi:uncharacterized RDD family membrane protein YckC